MCLLEFYLQQDTSLKPIYDLDRSSGRIVCEPPKLPKRTIIAYVSSIDSSGELFGLVLRRSEDHLVVGKLYPPELAVQEVLGYYKFPYQRMNGVVTTNVLRNQVIAYFFEYSRIQQLNFVELRKPLLIGLLCFIALLFVIKYGLSPSLFISFFKLRFAADTHESLSKLQKIHPSINVEINV